MEWRSIPGVPTYEVSSGGQIRHHVNKKIRTLSTYRYASFDYQPGPGMRQNLKRVLVHRAVALAFIPNPNDLPQVNHIDGNKLNNAVTNLEWCDSSYNHKHAFRTGLHKPIQGTAHYRTKLTEQDVLNIRSKYNPAIQKILNRQRWSHI